LGVGCDDRGPFPGVGGRGVSGGVSSGAGIWVPSVKEKLIGVNVSGLYLPTAMVTVGRVWLRVGWQVELAEDDGSQQQPEKFAKAAGRVEAQEAL
jgi:hypothetical protein